MNLREIEEPEDDEPPGPVVRVIGGRAAPEWAKEEVVRLETLEEPLQVKRIDRLQASMGGAVVVEKDRRVEKKRRAWGWGVAAGAVVLSLVGVVGGLFYLFATGDEEGDLYLETLSMDQSQPTEERVFEESLSERIDEAWSILARFAEADEAREIQDLLRDGQGSMSSLEKEWKSIQWPAQSDVPVESGSGEDGQLDWLALILKLPTGEDLRAAFVVEDGRLVLDWKATMAVGELPISELPDLEKGREVRMRLILMGDHFYDNDYPEALWRCFRYADAHGEQAGWVYARKGSEAAKIMETQLMQESGIVGDPLSCRIRARIRNGGQGDRRQFELTHVEGLSWIEGIKDL
ncbi:MAG: hypothetical protein MUF31_05405 [Akkermansiaceae bacterium]|jgi:hypothetical protein|nr:hypothetical protein [Akkermansiaceae bacterium]